MDNKRKFPLILSSFWIKVIALVAMTFDHIGYQLDGGQFYELSALAESFRYIGRLALPLFCFMIVEGVVYTKSFRKYALRLGIMASVISLALILIEVIPYFESMRNLGIIFIDLLLGAFAVFCLKQKKWYLKALALLPLIYGIVSFISTSFEACKCYGDILWFPFFMRTQYGWFAILLCILFYLARPLTDLFISYLSSTSGVDKENYRDSNIERHALNIISVLMLAIASVIYYVCGKTMPSQYIFWNVNMQLFAIVSGAFILLYNGRRGYNKKWFQYGSYLYYPAHMIVIYLIFEMINRIIN